MTAKVNKRRLYITWTLLGVVVLLSLLVLFQAIGLFDTSSRELQITRTYALDLAEYNLQQAENMGINPATNKRITINYNNLVNNINNATTAEAIYHIILTDMGWFEQTVIREEAERTLVDSLRYIINNDPNLDDNYLDKEITLTIGADQRVEMEGGEFLTEETLEELADFPVPDALRLQTVTFVVAPKEGADDGAVSIDVIQQAMEQDSIQYLENQYLFWEQELHSVLAVAGHSDLVGQGVEIRLWDAEQIEGQEMSIIHDYDIQAVVNYLNYSGAQGITVGNHRLINSSTIRCVGSMIQVNSGYIPVNPVVIAAVGNPDELLTTLEPLIEHFEQERNLRVEVQVLEELRLPAYRRQ